MKHQSCRTCSTGKTVEQVQDRPRPFRCPSCRLPSRVLVTWTDPDTEDAP